MTTGADAQHLPIGTPLPAGFYDRPVRAVAVDLLGCVLRSVTPDGAVDLRLVEVEAYDGQGLDPGSHAHRGRTRRNASMFGPPGHAYVYLSYGMHACLNVVTGPEGTAGAVLVRAGEVVAGVELAGRRRPTARRPAELARGPGRLTSALGIDVGWDGLPVTANADSGTATDDDAASAGSHPARRLLVLAGGQPPAASSPRTGVSGPGGLPPWRYYVPGDPAVSPYRPAVVRKPARPTVPPAMGQDGPP